MIPVAAIARCSMGALCAALALCASAAEPQPPLTGSGTHAPASQQNLAPANPELTVITGGRKATYAPSGVLAMPAATTVTVPSDVAYKREMKFRAIPAAAILAGVGAD